MTRTEDLWIVNPAGRRRDGSWVDDTIVDRQAETGRAGRAPDVGRFERQRVELVRGPGAWSVVDDTFRRRGWTDGLPVVPPTTGRVSALITAVERNPNELLAEVAPLGGLGTVEKVAANAVMAGCGPLQFPFVIAAVEAITDPGFGLVGVQTTDENVTPLLVISAPAARLAEAEINTGAGVLGPGWRGNATIGRAVRLVMQNLGGGWPDLVSFAGAGQPGRYTLCVAEDEIACPWEPLRVDLGYDIDAGVVVAMRAESAVNVTGGLDELMSVMGSATSLFTVAHQAGAAVLLAPHTAIENAELGRSRAEVADLLASRSHLDDELWSASWLANTARARSDTQPAVDGRVIEPADLLVVVAGGRIPIPQHVYFPGWGFGASWIERQVI